MFTAHSMLSTVLGPQEAVVNKSDFLLSRGLALVDVHSFVNLRIPGTVIVLCFAIQVKHQYGIVPAP